LLLLGISDAMADDAMLKAVCARIKRRGTVAEKTEQAKAELTAAGFSVVGDYSPYRMRISWW